MIAFDIRPPRPSSNVPARIVMVEGDRSAGIWLGCGTAAPEARTTSATEAAPIRKRRAASIGALWLNGCSAGSERLGEFDQNAARVADEHARLSGNFDGSAAGSFDVHVRALHRREQSGQIVHDERQRRVA